MNEKFINSTNKQNLIIFFILFLFLSGCRTNQNIMIPSIQVTTLPSPTKFPTPTKTQAPTSTFSPEEIQAQIAELLETNGGCDFPCWWGLMPGKTRFDDAQRFIEPLSISSGIWDTDPRIFYASIPVPNTDDIDEVLSLLMLKEDVHSDRITALHVGGYYFPMTKILNMFGEPSEVYYSSPLMFPSNRVSIELYLFFPENGIVVLLPSETISPDPNNTIRICDLDTQFDPHDWIGFIFWNPTRTLTFNEIINLPFSFNLPPFSPIEEISNMDPYSFYINFSQPNPECLEIDTSLYGSQTD